MSTERDGADVLDAAGRRTQMTDPDGGETFYVYDDNDRLTQLTNPQGEVTQLVYDDLDRVTQKTLANGVIEAHFFDDVGRETKVEQRNASGTVFSSFTKGRELLNRVHALLRFALNPRNLDGF